MEKIIKINLDDETVDIEIHGLSINSITNLSTIHEDVAENLKSTLILAGANPVRADSGVNLLLQGKLDIQGILKECF